IRIQDGAFDQALASVAPTIDAAIAAKDFPKAMGHLTPILDAEPAHRPSLEKAGDVREAEGNAAEAAALRLALGREEERRGNIPAAIIAFQKAMRAQPGNLDARAAPGGVESLALPPPPAPPPAEPKKAPEPEAFRVQELIVDLEEPIASPEPPPAAARPAPPPPPPAPARAAAPAPPEPPPALGTVEEKAPEQEIETLVVEAEVF